MRSLREFAAVVVRGLGPRLWSLYAATWDDAGDPLPWSTLAAELLPRSDGQRRLLDVGCGTGSHALALADRGFAVVGIDAANGMLRRAREKARSRPQVSFVHADFDDVLPFAPASFDAAVCISSLQCAADPARVVADLARVLRSGGRLVVLSSRGAAACRPAMRTRRRVLRATKHFADRSGLVPRFTAEDLVDFATAAGLRVTALREHDIAIALAAEAGP